MQATSMRPSVLRAGALAMFLCCGCLPVEASERQDLPEYSLELVNQAREAEGLPPLVMDQTLIQSAEAHAEDMLEHDYFAHVSPEGEDVMDRYLAAGGSEWRLVTENIGHCPDCSARPSESDIERQHEGWMESPDHRANILSEGLDSYGLGLAQGSGELYAVQNFSGPGTPRGLAEGEAAEPLPPGELAALAVELINERRAEQELSPLATDDALTDAAQRMVPEDLGGFALDEIDPTEALPTEQRADWRALATIAGSCGGCGAEPTDADIRYFIETWFGQPQYRDLLLDPDQDVLGLALRADGEGRKVAAAILASQ